MAFFPHPYTSSDSFHMAPRVKKKKEVIVFFSPKKARTSLEFSSFRFFTSTIV